MLIRITPEGVSTLNRVRTDRAAVIDPLLAHLNDEDREVLGVAVEVIRRLLDNAQTPK